MNQKTKVRAVLLERIRIGKPIDGLLHSLAKRAPSTLIDMAIGLEPLSGAMFTRSLLPLLKPIELRLSSFPIEPLQFYQRLADGSGEAAQELLAHVIELHPNEEWVCTLSSQMEGSMAGTTHLMAIHDQKFFSHMCALYVKQGVRQSLFHCSSHLGRVEPALALIEGGHLEAGLQAGALALTKNPSCGMIEYLCAVHGSDIDLPLSTLITHIHSISVLEKITPLIKWYPRARRALKSQKNRHRKEAT